MDNLKLQKEKVTIKSVILGILTIFTFLVVDGVFSFIISIIPKYAIIIDIIYYLSIIIIMLSFFISRLKRDWHYFKNNFKEYIKFIIKNQIIMFLIYLSISYIITILLRNPASSVNQQAIEKMPILMIVFVSILYAPIVEELLFRGSFRKMISNNKAFIIISGLIFGLLHTISETTLIEALLIGLPYIFCGMYFAFMYVKTENILVPITCHFIHNSYAVMLLIFSRMINI